MTDHSHNGNGHRDYSPSDALTIYQREISETQLITPVEEIALTRQIKRGNKTARELFIVANLRLVVSIAKKYENSGLPLLDLINEGNLGLMVAIERFDLSFKVKFATYGIVWIKQKIKQALCDQSRTIRIPIPAFNAIGRINKAIDQLTAEMGRAPDDEELAAELGIKPGRIRELRNAYPLTISIDSPLNNDSEYTIKDIVSDSFAEDPSVRAETQFDSYEAVIALEQLSKREQLILRMRYGLDTGVPMTHEDLSTKFGITRQRISQIEARSLEKLRNILCITEIINTSARWKTKKAHIIGTRKSPKTKTKDK